MNSGIYYSPSQNAFFDTAIHGTRQIWVIDQTTLDDCLRSIAADEDDFLSSLETASDTEKADMNAALDALSQARATLVGSPPFLLIDNLDCRLPEDAVEITNDQHQALLLAQANGSVIIPDPHGEPMAREVTFFREPQRDTLFFARARRDARLAQSDYTQLADSPLSASARKEWAKYRAALRGAFDAVQQAIAEGVEVDDDTVLAAEREAEAQRPVS